MHSCSVIMSNQSMAMGSHIPYKQFSGELQGTLKSSVWSRRIGGDTEYHVPCNWKGRQQCALLSPPGSLPTTSMFCNRSLSCHVYLYAHAWILYVCAFTHTYTCTYKHIHCIVCLEAHTATSECRNPTTLPTETRLTLWLDKTTH